MRTYVLMAAAAATVTLAVAQASVPTMNECFEASDFIANAARSRDNGIERDVFVGQMQQDFEAIRAFPPALRWFVKDEDDERFLTSAAASVYDRPLTPERHRQAFLRACLARLAAGAGTAASDDSPDTI